MLSITHKTVQLFCCCYLGTTSCFFTIGITQKTHHHIRAMIRDKWHIFKGLSYFRNLPAVQALSSTINFKVMKTAMKFIEHPCSLVQESFVIFFAIFKLCCMKSRSVFSLLTRTHYKVTFFEQRAAGVTQNGILFILASGGRPFRRYKLRR